MPQLTVKQVIAATLLRVCRQATDSVRPKEEAKQRKYSKEQVDEIHNMLKNLGWNADKIALQAKAYAALLDAPELNMPTIIPLEPFCVVVLESGESGHGYQLYTPLIVNSSVNRTCVHTDGILNHWSFGIQDKPRLATDEEIKQCIEELTDKQWRCIHTSDTYKPVMDEAMGQEVMVDGIEPSLNTDSEEVTLHDGRKITR